MYNFVFHDTEIDRLMLIMAVIVLTIRPEATARLKDKVA
jgi:hypothetical protein